MGKAHRVTESHPSASSVDYDVAGTRVWTGPPRRRIKLHPRPHAAQVLFFLLNEGKPRDGGGFVLLLTGRLASCLRGGSDGSFHCPLHAMPRTHPRAITSITEGGSMQILAVRMFGFLPPRLSGGLVCFVDGFANRPPAGRPSWHPRRRAGRRGLFVEALAYVIFEG